MRCITCDIEHDGSFGSGKFCSRACANTRKFSKESNEKKRVANLGREPWSKGLKWAWTTSTCEYCKKSISHRRSETKKYHDKCWRKCAGGYRKGSGHGKSGWYKGHWCDSSYELVWIIYQLDHSRSFERNTRKFEYEWKGKKRYYVPDFIQNDQFIEIKGYANSQTLEKLKSVAEVKVLFKKDLHAEFKYVESKYGKDFIKLYEGNPHNELTGSCKVCQKPCKKNNVYCSRKCSGKGNNMYFINKLS